MNFSVLNTVQITQQLWELLLYQIDVKSKTGGYNVKNNMEKEQQ